MLKKISLFLLTAALLTCVSFADSVTVSTLPRLHEQLEKAASGDRISISGSITDNSGFTVNDGVTLSSDIYTVGTIALSENAAVTNRGTIDQGILRFSSGTPSLQNLGRLYLNSVPAGVSVTNRGWVMSSGGLDLGGTFILESGGTLNFSTGTVTGSKSLIKMSLGARFVNKTNKNYTALLPDGSTVNLWNNTDFTVIKPNPPKIYLEDTGAAGQRLLTITCPDAAATIYFTIDGTDPDSRSNIYQKSVYVSANARVKACSRLTNSLMSDITDSFTEASSQPVSPIAEPVFLPDTTPAAENVNPPVINISGGTYPCRQILSLSCSTPGAEIHYTTDGSAPTSDSPLYTGSFDIVRSCTVKAIAIKNGVKSENILTEHYQLTDYTVSTPDYTDVAVLETFWSDCVKRIISSNGKTVTANAADCPYLSNTVVKALAEHPTDLIITRANGKTLNIPAGKAPKEYDNDVRVWYSLDSLSQFSD